MSSGSIKLFVTRPRVATEKVREAAEGKAHEMAAQNPTRVHLVEKLEELVESYNLGTVDVEAFFEALKALISEMEEEERRAAREGLTEDELAIFDLLTKPEPKLTKAQEVEVKKVARGLLIKLQDHVNVFDWKARQQTRAAVQSTIRFTLNELPEEPYPESVWGTKVEAVWGYTAAATFGIGVWQTGSAADLPVKASPPAAVYRPGIFVDRVLRRRQSRRCVE